MKKRKIYYFIIQYNLYKTDESDAYKKSGLVMDGTGLKSTVWVMQNRWDRILLVL